MVRPPVQQDETSDQLTHEWSTATAPTTLTPYNREVPIESGYVLDEAHSYDVVKTDGGYDIVFHFVKGGETDGNENSE